MERDIRVPDDSAGFLLWTVSKVWQKFRQQSLKGLGLSHVEFVVLGHLFWLSRFEPHPTQQKLSDWISVDKVSVAARVSVLQKKGLVRREVHPDDGRAYVLTVTKEGAAIARKGLKDAKRANETFFAPLGDRSAELIELLQTLLIANGSDAGEGE